MASPLILEILSIASSPVEEDALARAATPDGQACSTAVAAVKALLGRGFLVDADQSDPVGEQLTRWRAYGWGMAAEYHFHTFGYPFLEYDHRGLSQEDGALMHRYAETEPDLDRTLRREDASAAVAVADLQAEAVALADARSALNATVASQPLDRSRLLELIRLGIGAVATHRLPVPRSAPLILKTSPSGGSRHPTETYLLAAHVDGLDDGWYHVEHLNVALEYLGPDKDGTAMNLGLADQPGPRAILVFTCRFARNRYRYREPRTFRTIHMDAGHLLGTCELLASAMGLTATPRHVGDVSRGLAATLRLARFEEWPMAALTIEGSSS